jgi:hypothetical protein
VKRADAQSEELSGWHGGRLLIRAAAPAERAARAGLEAAKVVRVGGNRRQPEPTQERLPFVISQHVLSVAAATCLNRPEGTTERPGSPKQMPVLSNRTAQVWKEPTLI